MKGILYLRSYTLYRICAGALWFFLLYIFGIYIFVAFAFVIFYMRLNIVQNLAEIIRSNYDLLYYSIIRIIIKLKVL